MRDNVEWAWHMIRATDADKADVLKKLRINIMDNVYLYIDILMYGFNHEFSRVWIQRDQGDVKYIVLKYYDSFQLYAAEDAFDYSEIAALIMEYKPAMISGRADLIRSISSMANEFYGSTYGVVLSQPHTGLKYADCFPEKTKEEDMEEVAHLVCSDQGIGGHYKPLELMEQFIRRQNDKTGRNYIIRRDGGIVAHYATYAEASDIAVMSGMIVAPAYRGHGYARLLHCFLADLLISENKTAVLFCHEQDVLKMYLKLGAVVRGEYGKLTMRKTGNAKG